MNSDLFNSEYCLKLINQTKKNGMNSRNNFSGMSLDKGGDIDLQQKILLSAKLPRDIRDQPSLQRLPKSSLSAGKKKWNSLYDNSEDGSESVENNKKKLKLNDENTSAWNELHELDDNFAQQCTFPKKLMKLLEEDEAKDSLWWLPTGEAFAIEPKKFSQEVLEKSFQGTKFESFIRKLNRWGFKRIVGKQVRPNVVAYCHPCFQKGKPELLHDMNNKKKGKNVSKRGAGGNNCMKEESSSLAIHSRFTRSLSPIPTGSLGGYSQAEQILNPMSLRQVDQLERDFMLQSIVLQQQRSDFALQQRLALLKRESLNNRFRLTAELSDLRSTDLNHMLNLPSSIQHLSQMQSSLPIMFP